MVIKIVNTSLFSLLNNMKKYSLNLILILVITNISLAQQPNFYTSSEIYLQLKKLKVLGSVLYIAAHPDDENNTLLPYLAKEKLYRTAYLSLTRGDGGQNLIGSEQGVELGLIRTQELLAARKIDGAEQYFTRAYEFGYSKTSEETLNFWDKEKVMSDVVWMIRKLQPDVIITRFPPDSRAGHGHHSASAIIANEAFFLAADSTKFTEHFKYGVKPYQAKRILWNTFNFGGSNTTSENQLKIDVSGFNSLIGKSYGEIGAEARTMHKSQGEGRPRRRGPLFEYFSHTSGVKASKDLFDDVDFSWNRINNSQEIEKLLSEIISNFNFEKPEKSVSKLIELYKKIEAIEPCIWKNQKLQELKNIIESCAGLFAEASTNQEYAVQGDSVKINFFINNRKEVNTILKRIQIEHFDSSFQNVFKLNQNLNLSKSLPINVNKEHTQPYWLKEKQEQSMFVVSNQQLIGEAENETAYQVKFTFNIDGYDFDFIKPVQYKYVDPVRGELYQPLQIFPVATVEIDDENKMILAKNEINGVVKYSTYKKELTLITNEYLKLSNANNNKVVFLNDNNFQELSFKISTESLSENSFNVIEEATKKTIDKTLHQIKYDHIPTLTYFTNATIKTHKLNIKIVGKKIGYIIGAGDKVPESLKQIGYDVEIITDKDLTANKLKQYQAIITGIRAYNVNEWLTTKNEILNEYIFNGGNLIVQYLKSNSIIGKKIQSGPFPFSISAQLRVTEENAVVNFALPNHVVLNSPNKITNSDFENWVQERSTYQIEKSDSNFEFPLLMNDKNEKQSNGSLAIAKYGKGNIAYLSLAMFRQLPTGNAGAYRLMANIIALPKN